MFDGLAIDRSSTTDRVAAALRAGLFEGRIPPGAPLREADLAETFAVSRGTVREALRVLTAEGLLTRTPNKGVVVKVLDAHDIADLYAARRVLEGGALAAGRVDPVGLAALEAALAGYEAALRRGDQMAATDAHLGFHEALIGLTGSRRLEALGRALFADVRLAFAAADRASPSDDAQLADHRRLVELIRAGEHAVAQEELTRHLHGGAASLAAATAAV